MTINCTSGLLTTKAITASGAITANAGITYSGMLTTTSGINNGAKIAIQGQTDGTNARGIFMWDTSNSAWGIYMATSGGGTSLSGGMAPGGYAFSSYSLRFRCYDSSNEGFVWENSSNNALMSVRGNDGFYGVMEVLEQTTA